MSYYSSDSFNHGHLILMGRLAGSSPGAFYLQRERLALGELESQRRLAALRPPEAGHES